MTTRIIITEKQATLERIRSERIALGATLTGLAGELQQAAGAVKSAKVDAVINPSPEAERRAEAAGRLLEGAGAKRDDAEDRADVLDQAAAALEREIQELEREVQKAARAAAIVELKARLDAGRAAAREWVIAAVAAEMIKGVTVTDPGLAAICALEPGRHGSEAASAVYAAASARREAVERGQAVR